MEWAQTSFFVVNARTLNVAFSQQFTVKRLAPLTCVLHHMGWCAMRHQPSHACQAIPDTVRDHLTVSGDP